MTAHLTRGHLLFHQSRHQQAVEEYRQHLLEEPNDPQGHAHLALCLADLQQFEPATDHAQQAIGLAADVGFCHFVLANVMVKRNRIAEAKAAIDEAVRLDPYVPMFFFLRGMIHGEQHQWEAALADADAGLEIDPEEAQCLNLRAQCLMKLGRRMEAGESIDTALEQNPDNAFTHTTRGWSLLEQGETKPALVHFREALRLEPDFEWARAGIVEAMKSRHFIYRVFLAYMFWISRLSPPMRWGVVIGGYFGCQVLARTAAANPSLALWILPVIVAYVSFVLLTWLAMPIFNLLLRTSRFGRLALSADQTRGANLIGLLILVAVGFLGAWWGWRDDRFLFAAMYAGLLLIPVSRLFDGENGWPRWAMAGVTLLLAAIGTGELLSLANVDGQLSTTPRSMGLWNLFLLVFIGSQFLANALAGVRVKK